MHPVRRTYSAVVGQRRRLPSRSRRLLRPDNDAYSLRYSVVEQGLFDKFDLDVWYNSTAASSDTQQGAKQAFVRQILAQSFNSGNPAALVPPSNLAVAQTNGFRVTVHRVKWLVFKGFKNQQPSKTA